MSKETIEGMAKKGVGSVKEALGKATGNEKLQAEGMTERVAGAAEETLGKAKDVVHKATK